MDEIAVANTVLCALATVSFGQTEAHVMTARYTAKVTGDIENMHTHTHMRAHMYKKRQRRVQSAADSK